MRILPSATLLTAALLLAGCAGGAQPLPGVPGAPVLPAAPASLSGEDLCSALADLDIPALVGAETLELEPAPEMDSIGGCGGHVTETGLHGISAGFVHGVEAVAELWEMPDENAVDVPGIGDRATYSVFDGDILPDSGTMRMSSGEWMIALTVTPVGGTPVPDQTTLTPAFLRLLAGLGVPH